MKKLLLTFVLLSTFISQAQTNLWNNLLNKHVSPKGWVYYDNFKLEEKKLDNYLSYLNKTTPLKEWSSNKTKAFWINAYNAYTIKLILKNYPLKSILNIKQNGKNAWEIPFAKIGGKTYTLNHIEHQILRKNYNDPRIHVGVNCASISCPALPNKAFTENNIDTLLNTGIKSFINDTTRNRIQKSNIQLSQIFNWFQGDFTQQTDLITFINKYSKVQINPNAVIKYIEYDWNLNKH